MTCITIKSCHTLVVAHTMRIVSDVVEVVFQSTSVKALPFFAGPIKHGLLNFFKIKMGCKSTFLNEVFQSCTTAMTAASPFVGKQRFCANPHYYDYLSALTLDFDKQRYKVVYGDCQAIRMHEKGTLVLTATDSADKFVLSCTPTHEAERAAFEQTWRPINESVGTLDYTFCVESGEWLNLCAYSRRMPGQLYTTRLLFEQDPCRMTSDESSIAYYSQSNVVEVASWTDRPDLVNKVILSKWETCDETGRITENVQPKDDNDSLTDQE